jgi:integrase
MASIKQSATGLYQVRIRNKAFPTVCKSFHSMKDAQAWAKKTEGDMQSGRWEDQLRISQNQITLRQGLAKYGDEITVLKKSAVREQYTIAAICREHLCNKPMNEIKGNDIARLRDQWLTTLSPATVRLRMAIISHCYTIAVKEWGIECLNPVTQVRKPIPNNARNRRLFEGEFDAVIAASEYDGLKPVAELALATAMRLSEVVNLTKSDVSIKNRIAFLHDTKNGKPRAVPLSGAAIEIIEQLLKQPDTKLFNCTAHAISQAWARALKKARSDYTKDCVQKGIEPSASYLMNLRFHDLRHEQISRLFEMDRLNIMEIAAISGHRTVQMLGRYTHLDASKIASKLL